MNNSGTAIKDENENFKIECKKCNSVFRDDLDIDFGKVKAKVGGTSAGHNGIKSIDKFIGTDYSRVRIGIGHPKEKEGSTATFLRFQVMMKKKKLKKLQKVL